MRYAPLALAALLALSACRTEHPSQMPPATTVPTYEQAARTAPDVAGTYRLVGLNDRAVPTRAAMAEGCIVQLNGGTLTLGLDARYQLVFDARQVCDGDPAYNGTGAAAPVTDPPMAAPGAVVTPGAGAPAQPGGLQKQGLYTVVGHRVMFGNKVRLTLPEDAPETSSGPEALHYALFDHGRLDANGALRDTVLALTLDDLRTYVFTRERGAPAPATARTPRDLTAPIAPPDRPLPSRGEASAEDFFPGVD